MTSVFRNLTALFICLAVISACCFNGVSAEDAAAKKIARKVQAMILKDASFDIPFSSTGSLLPVTESYIAPKVTGVISKMNVDIGTHVRKGDVLYEFDDTYYKLDFENLNAATEIARARLADTLAGTRPEDLEMARVGVEISKVNFERAQRDFKRAEELFQRGAISSQNFEDAKSAFDAANLGLSNAEAAYSKAKKGATDTTIAVLQASVTQAEAAAARGRQMIEDCKVRALFDGVVVEKKVTTGSSTKAGDEHIRLLDDVNLRFQAGIPERYALLLTPGMPIEIHFDGKIVKKNLDFVVPRVDPSNRCVYAYVIIDNSQYSLPAYILGEFSISFTVKGIVIPTSALVYKGDKVFICSIQGNTAKFVEVKPEISSGGFVTITGTALEGMNIVSRAAAEISEGDPLEVVAGGNNGNNVGSEK
ncbi:MAG: efflux RND transporter periplasmic adaptor subunit [Candidatus Brocadiia bacterium]